MSERTSLPPSSDNFDPGNRYPGLNGKVVDWVEHAFEDSRLYLRIRFTDCTELCWQITSSLTIDQADLSDWRSGDFKQLGVFVRNAGNFVLVVAEATFGGVSTGIYDLYRIENGKIAEHWDTLQNIPPCSEWKSDNGKF
jgi:hypothetical protein